MGENLLGNGAAVAVIGIVTVFVVLGILWAVLALMQSFFARKKTDKRPVPQNNAPQATKMAAPEPQTAPKAAESAMDDEELIAVLTAAVAASLNTSTYNLNIRSYREVRSSTPAWNRAARSENVR